MEEAAHLERKMKKTLKMAIIIQAIQLTVICLISLYKPTNYQKIGLSLSVTGVLVSFALSKIHISLGKSLEKFVTFSPEEGSSRMRLHFTVFSSMYPVWAFCVYKFLQ